MWKLRQVDKFLKIWSYRKKWSKSGIYELNCDPMKQVFGLMDCFNIKNYCHKKYSHNRRICWICENDFCVCVPCEWENNLRGENIPTSKLMWQNPQTDSKWTKHWKTKCCENANQSNKVGGWAGVGRVQLRHLKKIPHGFGLLKYFTLSFFFFF